MTSNIVLLKPTIMMELSDDIDYIINDDYHFIKIVQEGAKAMGYEVEVNANLDRGLGLILKITGERHE